MSDETKGDAQAIIDAATEWESGKPQPLDVATLYSSREELSVLDLERFDLFPRRKRGSVSLTEADSLVGYVKEHDGDGTFLFADWRARRVVALLNGHHKDGPGWGDHRAVLTLTHTPEWQRWANRDGKLEGQVPFAEHIEDCTADIVDPPAADLLELAQTFQATSSVRFRTQQRLADGQRQLLYEETVDAKAGQKGEITIPEGFTLRLAPFDGSETVEMRARLRYRMRDGGLAIGYVLDRPDLVIREAFNVVLADVETKTEITAYRGAPPAELG